MALNGLTEAEQALLKFVFTVAKPWGGNRQSRKWAAFFDGDKSALDGAPMLKRMFLDLRDRAELSAWPLPGEWKAT
jgi:hypothetical protein